MSISNIINENKSLYIYSKYHSVTLDRFRKLQVQIGRGLPNVKIYIHPAETHRLLKFLFHIMGRLVPAHNKPGQSVLCDNIIVT